LQGAPRHLAVLELAVAKAGWGKPLPAGRALGLVLHESFRSIVAQQMEGAVVFALTAALHRQTDIHEGVVQQSNFWQCAMMKLAQAPLVETHFFEKTGDAY